MGRQKSTPTKLNNQDYLNLQKPFDYIPFKKRKSKKKNGPNSPTYNVILPSDKNKQFYLGQVHAGSTNNELPEEYKSCKMSFPNSETTEKYLVITLDNTSVVVTLLPENDLIKEIVQSKVFAIHTVLKEGSVFFDLYFSNLPLGKFTKRIGSCIQTLFSLFFNIPFISDEDEPEVDLSSEQAIDQLYQKVRKTRNESLDLGSEDVQDCRLKPELRPYQADAVRWMLLAEKRAINAEDELHPLYKTVRLKSGIDIYYNKFSGDVELVKPIVVNPTMGGILADEMGLGKTVEVLACILKHPKSESTQLDLDKTPAFDKAPRKRKLKEPTEVVDRPKKLKVPDDWVRSSSKKSQTFQALQMWYNSVLSSPQKAVHETHSMQCICGNIDEEGSVECEDCGKMQHGYCLGYKRKYGPYKCAQCWMSQPLLETKATLIVTPVSLRTQWSKEISKHVRGDLKILQYGDASTTPIYPTALQKYDIVLTTYSVLQAELRLTEAEKEVSFRHQRRYSARGSPLTRMKWWRLCLDEAQTVETPTSMVSEMAKKLSAHFRWAVTGTPISKEISDLHGLIDYLQMEPYNDKFTWENVLFNPYVRGEDGPMLKFLAQVLWRSSKKDVMDQINIPKQTVREHWLNFTAIEQYFYKCEHQFSCRAFLDKAASYDAEATLQSLSKSSLKTVLAPLLSLRQVCTHPNSSRTRYLASKKPVKSMKDLLDALIAKNTNESEEFLRIALSALNGLAGIYLLLQAPEQAIEQYRNVLQLYTRFTEEEKVAKLAIDKLQVIHTMHNLAEILNLYTPNAKTLRDETLLKDCAEVEQKYISKFINQSMSALQDSLLITANITKLQDSFILEPGRWYSDLLEWIYAHSFEQDLYSRIDNLHSVSNVACTIENARSLIYAISAWDEEISRLRDVAIEVVNDLYTHCPDDEFQIVVEQELVKQATDCHLRPQKKSSKNKCPLCLANDKLKAYELKLFSMSKRTTTFEEMSLVGSWKATPQELVFRAVLAIGRAKNADHELVKDGEVHVNILDSLKKEFKEVRRLWTYLDQQICAQDELDMCKIRLSLKPPKENDKEPKTKITPILKNLAYNLENKLETIHLLDEHELEHQRIVLHNEEQRNMALLERNLGTRNYLETLHSQHTDDKNLDPCPICKNILENQWCIVPCGHSYCLECIQLLINQTKGPYMQCSICRAHHHAVQISYIKNGEQNTVEEKTKIVGDYSVKVESIVRLILELKQQEPDVKILLFSSWVSVLKYVKEALTNNDILTEIGQSGTLERQIEKFKDLNQHVTALLLPLNLGGKGLNLIEATHVILTEPLLNSGEELQAIGRIHRIGQTKPTVVHKFFIKSTIEESIYNAVSSDAQNWEKTKVKMRQLTDLFLTADSSLVDPNS